MKNLVEKLDELKNKLRKNIKFDIDTTNNLYKQATREAEKLGKA